MATDSADSRCKHRRSPSVDESQEHSKRHKHGHHHRSHRRHGHHKSRSTSSRKSDEKTKGDSETRNGELITDLVKDAKEIAPPAVLNKIRVDYDMEEGEIVEDDPFFDGNAAIENETTRSSVESGEIAAGSEIEYLDMKDAVIKISNSVGDDDSKRDLVANSTINKSESKKTQCRTDVDIVIPMKNSDNKDMGGSRNGDTRSRRRSHSPVRGGDKRKRHSDPKGEEGSSKNMEVEGVLGHEIESFSLHGRMLRNRRLLSSPSDSRYDTERWSESAEGASERSLSQLWNTARPRGGDQKNDDVLYENGKIDYNSDDERVSQASKEYRHGCRDSLKDKERENSRFCRYTVHEDRHSDRRSQERDRDSRDREEELKKASRDYEREKEHRKGREKEGYKNRDIGREPNRELERDREKARQRSRDLVQHGESVKDREREKNRGRSKERDLERERKRDSSRAAIRDKYAEIGWETDIGRHGDTTRDRRVDRIGDGRRDRHEYKSRDVDTHRTSRYHRYDDYDGGFDDWEKSRDSNRPVHDATEDRRDRGRERDSRKYHIFKDKSALGSEDKQNRDEEDLDDYQERIELKLAEQEEEDLNRIKEESRRRREAILQKYKNLHFKQQIMHDLDDTGKEKEPVDQTLQSLDMKDARLQNVDANSDTQDADVADTSFSVGKSPPANNGIEKGSSAGGLGEGTPKSERSGDMFCDDIFGDSPAGIRKSGKAEGLQVESSGLHDNWDDPEGYYNYRIGEVLDGRYEVMAAHGKGVFSSVIRAKDLRAGSGDPEEVAVKIIRNNETMWKAGMEELVILKKLVCADPDDRRHCVRFLSSFKYRNHLCLVFESLHMNLREVLKKFGRNIGLKITAVRAYAKQLFIALKHLRNCGVLHCDIKPDNMLVNGAKNVLKLCDFGNAMIAGKNEITPYLVSRFYRAPEIILGLNYDHPMDIWSVGCCLYELYTGKVLFPGHTNNDMLRLHMELKGPFPKKMLRKGAFIEQHFDQDLNFLAIEEDPVTKKAIKRLIVNIKPKEITTIIKGSPGEDPKMLANFKDLLDKIFMMDPDKRLTVAQALNHPFITGKGDDIYVEARHRQFLVICSISIEFSQFFGATLQCLYS
ncbi:hypothetical protein Dimus_014727 [Dionaea muscipula]